MDLFLPVSVVESRNWLSLPGSVAGLLRAGGMGLGRCPDQPLLVSLRTDHRHPRLWRLYVALGHCGPDAGVTHQDDSLGQSVVWRVVDERGLNLIVHIEACQHLSGLLEEGADAILIFLLHEHAVISFEHVRLLQLIRGVAGELRREIQEYRQIRIDILQCWLRAEIGVWHFNPLSGPARASAPG